MKRRSYRGKPTALAGTGIALLILAAGLLLGALSQWADLHVPALAELTSRIALWILLASAAALGSRSPLQAALHTLLLLGGMVAAYYTAAYLMDAAWSKSYLIGWGAAALLSPIAGWLVWYARGEDKWAWLVSAGVLAAQIGGTLALFQKVRAADVVVIALTAVMLLAGKVKNLKRARSRRWRR